MKARRKVTDCSHPARARSTYRICVHSSFFASLLATLINGDRPGDADTTVHGVRAVVGDRGLGYAKCNMSGVLRRLGLVRNRTGRDSAQFCCSERALPGKPQSLGSTVLLHGTEATAWCASGWLHGSPNTRLHRDAPQETLHTSPTSINTPSIRTLF